VLTVYSWRLFSWLSEPEVLSILPEWRFSDMVGVTAESSTGRRVMERKLHEDDQILYITLSLLRLTYSAAHYFPFNPSKLCFRGLYIDSAVEKQVQWRPFYRWIGEG